MYLTNYQATRTTQISQERYAHQWSRPEFLDYETCDLCGVSREKGEGKRCAGPTSVVVRWPFTTAMR